MSDIVNTSLQNIKAEVDSLELKNVNLVAKVAGLEAHVASLSSANSALNTQVVDLKAEIIRLSVEIDALKAEVKRLTDLYEPKPKIILLDGTRKQFLGHGGFNVPCPFMYESAFYPSTVTEAQRPVITIDKNFVMNTAIPKWRALYPTSPRWSADIEWQNSGGVTSTEVSKILPAFQGAKEYFATEGKGVKLGAYGFPRRWGVDVAESAVAAQQAISKPIHDLLDESHLTLYPIYTDLTTSRRYIQQNIDIARKYLPGKPVYVIGWPVWHPNVGAPLAGTEVSKEWWQMFLDECLLRADGLCIWLMSAAPQPTNEQWWEVTKKWVADNNLA